MSNKKELLLAQMKANYNSPGWYPTLEDALSDLNMDQAKLNSSKSSHSIWELVNHLTYWNERWLDRFKNINLGESMENNLTFKDGDNEKSNENWNLSKEKIYNVFSNWVEEIEKTSESRLDSAIDPKKNIGLWWEAISYLILHNSYHIGQIISLRKQQDNWINKY